MYDSAYFNRVGAEELMARLREETLLMQGPMGSVLLSEEDAAGIPPAFWNLGEPSAVEHIHALYVAAGAQVLLTNTFQASAPALERDGIAATVEDVNRAAVDAARACQPQMLMGSMGPCGITWFQEDSSAYRAARAAYRVQAYTLLAAGVDGIMLETFTSIRDAEPALVGVLDIADGMPVCLSFSVDGSGSLIGDGLTIEGAVLWAEKHGATMVGINCCEVSAADATVPRMVAAARTPVCVRPNAGDPVCAGDGTLTWHEDAEEFALGAVRWSADGARMVGGCCGTSAVSVAAMADALDI